MDIIEELREAAAEYPHYYTDRAITNAIAEIERLRARIAFLEYGSTATDPTHLVDAAALALMPIDSPDDPRLTAQWMDAIDQDAVYRAARQQHDKKLSEWVSQAGTYYWNRRQNCTVCHGSGIVNSIAGGETSCPSCGVLFDASEE